jgi:hypothetical protein
MGIGRGRSRVGEKVIVGDGFNEWSHRRYCGR